MAAPEPHSYDGEALPRPPPVRGKLPRWLLKALENGEVVTFMAIAVALLAIAIVVFVSGSTTSWWRRRGGRAVRLPGPGAALRQARPRLTAPGPGSPSGGCLLPCGCRTVSQ